MDRTNSLHIIRCLADGVDPNTGEVFALDSPYQHPNTIRALFAALQSMERDGQELKSAKNPLGNSGKSWDIEEDKRLADKFAKGTSIEKLAQEHGRTRGAIQSRLEKLGKMVPQLKTRAVQTSPSNLYPEPVDDYDYHAEEDKWGGFHEDDMRNHFPDKEAYQNWVDSSD